MTQGDQDLQFDEGLPAQSEALVNLLASATPGGIERQELKARDHLCKQPTQLPHPTGEVRNALEKLGFVFGKPVNSLFIECRLPDDWSMRPTESAYWTNLCDNKGRARFSIFYKAAFYDQRASISPNRRYSINLFTHTDGLGVYKCVIRDQDSTVHEVGTWVASSPGAKVEILEKAQQWMGANYPDYNNPYAYWN